MTSVKRFLIVDDHPLYLDALAAVVGAVFPEADIECAGNVDDAEQIMGSTGKQADLVLLDLYMPGKNGFEGLRQIKGAFPKLPVILISRARDASIVEHARLAGASGFIHKSADRPEIKAAVEAVMSGKTWFARPLGATGETEEAIGSEERRLLTERVGSLTPRQFKVLELICDGKLNKQIAYELGVGETTVKAHITAMLKKLEVFSRTQAVLVMQQIKLHEASLNDSEKDP